MVLAVAAVVLQFCGGGLVGEGDDGDRAAPPIDAADLVATDPVGVEDLTADQRAQLDQFIAQATADLEGFWVEAYPAAYGGEYTPLTDAAPTFPTRGPVACESPVSVVHNALYCAAGDFVTWDGEELFPNLATNFGLGAIAAVLAHEWGHAVQSPVRHDFEGATITRELQADCFAGAWFGGRVASGGGAGLSLDTRDMDGAIAALLLLRDSFGAGYGDPRADGSGFDRVRAFADGERDGVHRCAGYEADGISLVDVPLATGEAQDRSLAEAVESVTDHLPVFFADHVELGQQLYDPSRRQPNPCPAPTIGPVSLCEDTATVVGDAAQLRHLHDRIGDFSAALLFAAEWGRAVAISRGITEEASIDLMGECLAGAWAGEVAAAPETGVVLAPGDLDEALATLLRFGRGSAAGSAVLRSDMVQLGFLDGPEACFELNTPE